MSYTPVERVVHYYDNCQNKWAIILGMSCKNARTRARAIRNYEYSGTVPLCDWEQQHKSVTTRKKQNKKQGWTCSHLLHRGSFTWVLPLKFDGAYRNFEGSSSTKNKKKIKQKKREFSSCAVCSLLLIPWLDFSFLCLFRTFNTPTPTSLYTQEREREMSGWLPYTPYNQGGHSRNHHTTTIQLLGRKENNEIQNFCFFFFVFCFFK